MKTVRLHDKEFEIFIDENEINNIISQIANQINDSKIEKPLFLAILNGSFLFAADLIRKINVPDTEISFLKLSSYVGTSSKGNVDELIGLSKNIEGRKTGVASDTDSTKIAENEESVLNSRSNGRRGCGLQGKSSVGLRACLHGSGQRVFLRRSA